MREVHDPHDAEDQRQAQREQYVRRGDLQTVHGQLYVDVQLLPLLQPAPPVQFDFARRCCSSCGTTRSTSTSLPSWIWVITIGSASAGASHRFAPPNAVLPYEVSKTIVGRA